MLLRGIRHTETTNTQIEGIKDNKLNVTLKQGETYAEDLNGSRYELADGEWELRRD